MQDTDTTFRVVIDAHRSNSMAALFDMMRYDGNTVLAWDHHSAGLVPSREGADYWTVTLHGRCTRDRWSSFGMPVFLAHSSDPLPLHVGTSLAEDIDREFH